MIFYLKCNQLFPGDALLHELPVCVDDVEDDGDEVTNKDGDDQHLASLGLAAGGALGPVLKLHCERGGLQGGNYRHRCGCGVIKMCKRQTLYCHSKERVCLIMIMVADGV